MTMGRGEINLQIDGMFQRQFERISEAVDRIREEKEQLEAILASGTTFDNGLFPLLDAGALLAMVKWLRPKRYIEIGSGYSTTFAKIVIDREKLEVDFTSIDPEPRLQIDHLCTRSFREPMENVWNRGEMVPLVDALEARDILFMDSMHIVASGNEDPVFYGEILPRLKRGVVVHIHDIFLPWDYPQQWISEGRAYTEQYLVLTLLANSDHFEPLFPSHWVQRNPDFADLQTHLQSGPLSSNSYDGGSLWLVKN